MRIIEVIPATNMPLSQPAVLSYFWASDLPPGTLVEIPLGRRKETGIVVGSSDVSDLKMMIKKAGFEMRGLSKIISQQPMLTKPQIELALWLGNYYLAPPGLFLKMCLHRQLSAPPQGNGRQAKKQKLILAPTIAQAKTLAEGQKDAVLWHSGLSAKKLSESWWKIKNGQAQTIIGTRSAIFLPFAGLKELVIHDETNAGHRSWDMFPRYNASQAAQKLALIFDTKLEIKDSLPSARAVAEGTKFTSPGDSVLIDMRLEIKEKNFSIFSAPLKEAIKTALKEKGRAVMLINRKGAANFLLCRDCGLVVKCQNCDAPMAYHFISGRPLLFCHHCGAKNSVPEKCPKCSGWRLKTAGAGTQKAEIEAQKSFPEAKIFRLDGDIAPLPKQQEKIINEFVSTPSAILVATQSLFSWKGQISAAQPRVMAILSADSLLHLPDFNSGERTLQAVWTMRQLNPEGQTFIQTYNPENETLALAAKSDWKKFFEQELATRQILKYPPFSQIAKLVFRHKDAKKAGQEAKILATKLNNVIASSTKVERSNPVDGKKNSGSLVSPSRERNGPRPSAALGARDDNIEISPALPAFIPREKGRFVWQIIIKFPLDGPADDEFLKKRNFLLQYVPDNWQMEIDPEDLL